MSSDKDALGDKVCQQRQNSLNPIEGKSKKFDTLEQVDGSVDGEDIVD